MPRLPRIQVDGAIYYVTSRGPHDREIFKEKADYQMYLDLLAKYKKEHQFKVFSYCLMPDRLQLLIEPSPTASISEIMHDLNSLYTKYYNNHYDRRGPLFESRFKSVFVEKAKYLLQMTIFMHRGPASGQPNPFSSFAKYISRDEGSMGMTAEVSEVMEQLKNSVGPDMDYASAVSRSGELLEPDLEKKLNRGSMLGSEAFVEKVREKINAHVEVQHEQKTTPPSNRSRLAVAVLLAVACASAVYFYYSREALETKYQNLLVAKQREYFEKSRFENRSPIALTELDGTTWSVEMLSAGGGEIAADTLNFNGKKILSEKFKKLGFAAADVTRRVRTDGVTVWDATQHDSKGGSLVWHGEWNGDVMKGVLSQRPAGKPSLEYTFFSTGWSYTEGAQ